MKFETLKKSHLKRNIIIGVVAVLIISAAILTFTRAKYRVTESIPLVNGTINYTLPDLNIVGLYIDGEEASELDSTKTYILDTTQSTCTYRDGSAIPNLSISYDSNTGELQISPLQRKEQDVPYILMRRFQLVIQFYLITQHYLQEQILERR